MAAAALAKGGASKMAMGALSKGGASKMMATAARGQMGAARVAAVRHARATANRCRANPEACMKKAQGQALGAAKFVGNMRGAVKPQGTQTAAPVAPGVPAAGGQPKSVTYTYAKGGVVRKGGRYYLHKGEKVVAKRSVSKVTKAMQKDGMRVRHKGPGGVRKVPFVPLSKLRKMGNGGAVLKTGLHVLKAGQRVIPTTKVPRARKAIKKA